MKTSVYRPFKEQTTSKFRARSTNLDCLDERFTGKTIHWRHVETRSADIERSTGGCATKRNYYVDSRFRARSYAEMINDDLRWFCGRVPRTTLSEAVTNELSHAEFRTVAVTHAIASICIGYLFMRICWQILNERTPRAVPSASIARLQEYFLPFPFPPFLSFRSFLLSLARNLFNDDTRLIVNL